jgi:UrcA family protein
MKKSFTMALAAGLLCSALASAVQAGDAAAVPSVAVQYGDLDLQTDAGQQVLKQRFTQAARSVCPGHSSRDLGTRLTAKRCIRQSLGRARADFSEQQMVRAAEGRAAPQHRG